MSNTVIRVKDNGPLVVRGPFTIEDGEGRQIVVDKEVVGLCRCGRSANKPFCDGSHTDAAFSSEVRTVPSA